MSAKNETTGAAVETVKISANPGNFIGNTFLAI